VISFEKARPCDARVLADISRRAFNTDVFCGAPGPGGPPGYDSPEWQARVMRFGYYYKIVKDGRVVGGFIVFRKGRARYEVGRIHVDPDYHNQGIGAQAMRYIEELFSDARKLTLGTPAWNVRTRHFYEKLGYVVAGRDGPNGLLYEKRIAGRG